MSSKLLRGTSVVSFVFAFVILIASGTISFAVCPTGSNLIVNGDGEADQNAPGGGSDFDVSGWEPEIGEFTIVRYGAAGGYPTTSDPGPANRGNFFFTGGAAASSSGKQIIDLTGCGTQIDAGNLNFSLSGYLGGYFSDTDQSQISLVFKSASNSVLASYGVGPVTPADRMNLTGLLLRTTNSKIPFGAVSAEITLSMTRINGSDNDGYADNLSFIATPSSSAGQIIYSRSPNNDLGTIWAINPDGTNDHQIASGNFPRISPDGKFLMYRRKISTGTDVNYQASLYILNLSTGTESLIYGNNNDYITGYDFATNEQKIFLDYGCIIVKMDYDGSNRQTIDSNCYDDSPTPRKSDELLTFHGFNGEIFTSNPDGSNRQAVPGTSGNNYSPFWSNDGQFIYYTHYDGFGAYPYNNDALYKIRPDGTNKILVKSFSGTDRLGSMGVFNTDGSKVSMPATIGGVSGIYQFATDGSGAVSLGPVSNDFIAAGSNADVVGGISPNIVTAASVSVKGRVTSSNGRGISGGKISIIGYGGQARTALTNSFGYYNFDKVSAGQSYLIQVSAKRYTFAQNSQVISLVDNLDGLNFTSNE